MKVLLLLSLLLLTSCSSKESVANRAPVYDAILNKITSDNRADIYIAGSKIVELDTYTVRAGDTMYSIAWRAGIDVNTLIKLNKIKKPYTIHTGQILQLNQNNKKVASNTQSTKSVKSTGCSGQSCSESKKSKVVTESPKEYSPKVSAKSADKVKQVKQVKQDKQVKQVKQDKQVKQVKQDKVVNWKWPSKGRLTKTFAKSVQGMKGISISNTRGTPVYAAASGKVVYSGNGLRGYGNLIIIRHNFNYLSAYAHNEKLMIKENEQVKIGQQIATMGDSGTDNIRLHFDIRYQGKSVDPLRYLPKQR